MSVMDRGSLHKTDHSDKRAEIRMDFESILLPFFGSRLSDQAGFEYILQDISGNGLRIALPKWIVSREHLKTDERINLHLPFRFDNRCYTEGKIVWSRWDDAVQGMTHGVLMDGPRAVNYPVYVHLGGDTIHVEFSEPFEHLLKNLIKDAVFLKKGILVYLDHLIPYFSRLGGRSREEYDELKSVLLLDMRRHVVTNLEQLTSLYDQLKAGDSDTKTFFQFLNLETFREAVRSEVFSDVLITAMEADTVTPYLDAIKTLEQKQYSNYNTLVMLYIHA